mmetsp:Transcript_21589/g.37007  ORF Transcript_21589/g.37007 Transcript_21589/m.37007 type:complete len:88 (+) Transcript_21589:253-516(+)
MMMRISLIISSRGVALELFFICFCWLSFKNKPTGIIIRTNKEQKGLDEIHKIISVEWVKEVVVPLCQGQPSFPNDDNYVIISSAAVS